jgi:hypothetical protein
MRLALPHKKKNKEKNKKVKLSTNPILKDEIE